MIATSEGNALGLRGTRPEVARTAGAIQGSSSMDQPGYDLVSRRGFNVVHFVITAPPNPFAIYAQNCPRCGSGD